MRKIILGAVVLCLSLATSLSAAPALAQTRIPGAQTSAITTRTYLGCSINAQHYLSLRNTTSATLRVGTPVYWSGKQQGQPPRQYAAPLYADVVPDGVYQIGGAYKYDPSAPCRVWIRRTPLATLAP
jgi:hypothetical protein